jgi:vanadium chloroperoxidase
MAMGTSVVEVVDMVVGASVVRIHRSPRSGAGLRGRIGRRPFLLTGRCSLVTLNHCFGDRAGEVDEHQCVVTAVGSLRRNNEWKGGHMAIDPILYWNDVALEANRVSHTDGRGEQTGPPLSARALAIVHLAMYDAFAGASGNPADLPPYLSGLPDPAPGASVAAAVAAAAHETLSELFPGQSSFFDQKRADAGLTDPGRAEGEEFGHAVAHAILADRQGDPDAGAAGHQFSDARGDHRPDPDNPGQGIHAPFFGARCKGFAITARHELDPPPQPDTRPYIRALREVRAKGVAPQLMGTVDPARRRAVDETAVGVYWAYDGAAGLGTPPRLYNQIVREIATRREPLNTPAENARLFALVNVAMADAGVLSWDQKFIHDLWRPVLGIREHDPSMGPGATIGDDDLDDDCQSDWLPLGAPSTNTTKRNFTPPFPAYPSGHATFGAAALHMARLFYGVAPGDHGADDLFDGLTFVSEELNGVNLDRNGTVRPRHVRRFSDGLWQMIEENGRSRVYLGVHWVFDAFAVTAANRADLSKNVGGVPLGLTVAEDIFNGGRANGLRKSTVGPRP